METQQATRYARLVTAIASGEPLPPTHLLFSITQAAGKSPAQLQADVDAERKERGLPETERRTRPGTNYSTR